MGHLTSVTDNKNTQKRKALLQYQYLKSLRYLGLLAFSLTAACTSPPKSGAIAIGTFASASTEASGAITNAFQLVNEAHYGMQAARYMADFDKATRPPIFERFVSQESILARARVFEHLGRYSALLVDMAGGEKITELDSATSALAETLNKFSISPDEQLATPEISAGIASAINSIGRNLIEKKRISGIESAAKLADPYVQKICELLLKDVKTLQSQLKINNLVIVTDQFKYLKENTRVQATNVGAPQIMPLNPIQKRDEIGRITKLALNGMYSDDFLAQLLPMIESLGTAHASIAQQYGASATGNQMAINFFYEVQRVKRSYSDLRKNLEGE